jgi:hypothetical protein
MLRRWAIWSFIVVALGCAKEPYSTVKARGRVLYDDGSIIPAQRITLHFDPQAAAIDEKTHPREAIAEVNVADGTFDKATTYKYGDGLIRGEHKVVLFAIGRDGKLVVPKEYGSAQTTPLLINTEQESLDIRIPKAKGK